jgi:hypothetical protein
MLNWTLDLGARSRREAAARSLGRKAAAACATMRAGARGYRRIGRRHGRVGRRGVAVGMGVSVGIGVGVNVAVAMAFRSAKAYRSASRPPANPQPAPRGLRVPGILAIVLNDSCPGSGRRAS